MRRPQYASNKVLVRLSKSVWNSLSDVRIGRAQPDSHAPFTQRLVRCTKVFKLTSCVQPCSCSSTNASKLSESVWCYHLYKQSCWHYKTCKRPRLVGERGGSGTQDEAMTTGVSPLRTGRNMLPLAVVGQHIMQTALFKAFWGTTSQMCGMTYEDFIAV